MFSFSACMTFKISQLKFGAHELKERNGAVLNRLKRVRGLGPPIKTYPINSIRSSGGPIFPIFSYLVVTR